METGFYRLRNTAKTLRVVFDVKKRKCVIGPGQEMANVELPVKFAERLKRAGDLWVTDSASARGNGVIRSQLEPQPQPQPHPPPPPPPLPEPEPEPKPREDVEPPKPIAAQPVAQAVPIQEEITPGLLADLLETGRVHHFKAARLAKQFLAHVPDRKADTIAALRDEQIRLNRRVAAR